MRRLSLFMVFVACQLVEGPLVSAQTVLEAGIPPCIAAPGRPTLKRRSPTPPSADDGNVGPTAQEKVACSPEDPAASSLNNQQVVRVEFEGPHAFTEKDIVIEFHKERLVIPPTKPDPETLAKGVTLIEGLLESRGYFHAKVDMRDDVESGAIVFRIAEGKRLPLAAVRFEGNKDFSSDELEAKTREYLGHYQETADEYDAVNVEFALRRTLNFVRSRGYLQATLGEPKKEIDPRGLILSVAVDEGRLYRLGEIRIEGAAASASEKLRALLRLRRGDIADGEAIGKWLFEDLRKVYGEQGFIEYTAEPVPEFRAAANSSSEGIVDFRVYIEEGGRFRVETIKFQGSSLADEELLRVLKIRAGDVFNQRLFAESIGELNKLGLFELIDKDKDTDFRTNEELSTVSIVIKLNIKDSSLEPEE